MSTLVPDGYRLLNNTEPLEPGDLWYTGINARWLPARHERQPNNIYCRKIDTTEKHPPMTASDDIMMKALEPFAKAFEELATQDYNWRDEQSVIKGIKFGDLRQAYETLSAPVSAPAVTQGGGDLVKCETCSGDGHIDVGAYSDVKCPDCDSSGLKRAVATPPAAKVKAFELWWRTRLIGSNDPVQSTDYRSIFAAGYAAALASQPAESVTAEEIAALIETHVDLNTFSKNVDGSVIIDRGGIVLTLKDAILTLFKST